MTWRKDGRDGKARRLSQDDYWRITFGRFHIYFGLNVRPRQENTIHSGIFVRIRPPAGDFPGRSDVTGA